MRSRSRRSVKRPRRSLLAWDAGPYSYGRFLMKDNDELSQASRARAVKEGYKPSEEGAMLPPSAPAKGRQAGREGTADSLNAFMEVSRAHANEAFE